jgi:2-polyprenyl-3-methyl-5-hydroxy-6-metoxy-1,4-benzoquinol methylase
VTTVREGQIESRKLVTNAAIINAIVHCAPGTVLDIGCGEGWLARALGHAGVQTTGIDAVPGLIEAAVAAGGGTFHVAAYEDIAAFAFDAAFDVAVCNFSLLGKESVEALFAAIPALLNPHGRLIVQTLHPLVACGDSPYQDGWREGSWTGFGAAFRNPAPWYFRTLESWFRLFNAFGFNLREMHEPIHPQTQRPVSVIFSAESCGL